MKVRLYCFVFQHFEYFMGQCASPPPRKKTTHLHDRQPADTESYKNKQLPKLHFQAVLANVKLKKYPFPNAIPVFKVREGESFTLPCKKAAPDDTLSWKFYQKFGFQMTEYELRKQFLEVAILNELKQTLGAIRINLFLIITGPFHQDFAVNLSNSKLARISFDLKISQIVQLGIESELAEIDLIKKHPGQEFSYSIKTIAGYNGSSAESQPSYPAVVLLDKKPVESSRQVEDLTMDLEPAFNRRKSQRMSTKQIQKGGNLNWTRQGGQLPSLTTKVVASELHNTYFQILIWKYQSSDESATPQLFADCYVSFYKLFGAEAKQIMDEEVDMEQRSITMTEKIEHYGKEYGKGKFMFKITNQPYFKQHQICVHTEVGILKTSPIFGIEETKTSEKSPQLQNILQISAAVEQNIILLNKLQSNQGPNNEIRRTKLRIEADLQKIFTTVQKSSLPPAVLYSYSNEAELLKGQKILVQLGMKVAEYFQIQDPVINDICWLILISLIKRSQFSLSHMGFNQKQKKLIFNGKMDQQLKEKQRVALMYKLFLYKLLELALSSLNHKGSQYERTFAEIFSAYAYFRIPQFRKQILRLITKDSDPEIIQWRGIQFNLTDDISQRKLRQNANTFSEMFDWQHHFYKCLLKDQKIETENQNLSLNNILGHQAWKERFIKRGLAFFYFINYWVIYVESTLPITKDIQWRYFPGYNRLLKGFFVEMKLRPILEYPDALIEAGLKLLINQKLLNPFIKIIFNKVNVFETSAVMRVIDYLNLIFKSFTQKQKMLPISFNYIYFFKGLKIMLQSQFSLAVSATLTFIYTHFNLFHIEFKRSLSMFMLGKIFNHLFLHWSYNVRHVFYHLLTYRIYKQANQFMDGSRGKFSIQDTDIIGRYDDLMEMLEGDQKKYMKEKIAHFQTNLDKQLHRKMKMVAYQKIRKNRTEKEEVNNPTKAESDCKHSNQPKTQTKFQIASSRKLTLRQERHSSEVFTPKVYVGSKQNEVNSLNKKKVQVKRLSKTNQYAFEHYDQLDGQCILFQKIIPQKQYQMTSVTREQMKYIPTCLPAFKQIQKQFITSLQKSDKDCPILKHELAIDHRQIRPQKIDDW